jgi:hypothetical protein
MSNLVNTSRNLLVILFCTVFFSCETDDILPVVQLSADNNSSISEENETITLTATLNAEAGENVNFNLNFSGTANSSSDYSASSTTLTIASGESSGSITITGLPDDEVEDLETIIVGIDGSQVLREFSSTEIEISLLDEDSLIDTDNDGVLDIDDDCPNAPGQASNNGCPFQGIFNEVLYDPPSGLEGDANNDGTRDANGDEFIEIYHPGPGSIDLTGFTISDADELRHTFPSGTIMPPNSVLVLFGSGNPTGDFGGAIVQTASEGLINMNNAGDFVTMADPDGNPVITFDVEPLSNNPDESYTRFPDITGEFVQHNDDIEEVSTLFSPGTKIDGSAF